MRYALFFLTEAKIPMATRRSTATRPTLVHAWNGVLRNSIRTSDFPFGISTARRVPNALYTLAGFPLTVAFQ